MFRQRWISRKGPEGGTNWKKKANVMGAWSAPTKVTSEGLEETEPCNKIFQCYLKFSGKQLKGFEVFKRFFGYCEEK